tara:strand:+ start:99 stop:1238 length:1140 start_codon:yes stop_codon:yes gene_type:complete
VKRNNKALLLIVLMIVIAGVALGVFLSSDQDEDGAPIHTASVASNPADVSVDESESKISNTQQAANSEQALDSSAAALEKTKAKQVVETPPLVSSPSFDVVRISPNGRAVIAGRAEPGSQITVLEDGIPLGTVEVDRRGEWVLVPNSNLKSGDRQLSLIQEMPDGSRIASDQVVVLSVPKPQKKQTQVEITASSKGDSGEGVIAVLVEREGGGPSKVLQSPDVGGEGIGDKAEVTIRSVDYNEEGDVTLAGQTEPEALINVYVDEVYVGSAKASEEGDWELSPEQEISPGQHRVRIDKVDDSGNVLARIEIPISRARPEELLMGDALVVVQPGNSLWRIARRAYGGGIYYSEIYGANRAHILDPNMIFPGQIFTLPVLN